MTQYTNDELIKLHEEYSSAKTMFLAMENPFAICSASGRAAENRYRNATTAYTEAACNEVPRLVEESNRIYRIAEDRLGLLRNVEAERDAFKIKLEQAEAELQKLRLQAISDFGQLQDASGALDGVSCDAKDPSCIIVRIADIGGYVAREDDGNIASTILYHLAKRFAPDSNDTAKVCPNCDTEMPIGCEGDFINERSCLLRSLKTRPDQGEGEG